MNTKKPEIRIDENEVSKISEDLFATLLSNFEVIFTVNGKDTAVSVPYDDYVKLDEAIKKKQMELDDIASNLKK